MASQLDYTTKLVNNSYNSMGVDYQKHNTYNRPQSYTRMINHPPDNYFGIKTVKTPYAFDDDNIQYKLPLRPPPSQFILKTQPISKIFH
jgi:hypothetical protein